MLQPFFTIIFRGSSAVLCAVTIPPVDLRSLSLYYSVCGSMCMSSVCVWCSCLSVITNRQYVVGPARPRTQRDCHHDTEVKPEAATALIELLMMGGKTPETC
jgi:hypothetical protein